MANRALWRRFYRQQGTIQRATGRDVTGKPTYGPPIGVKGRLTGESRMVVGAAGEEIMVNHIFYLDSDDVFSPDDLLTLSTGDVGSTESYARQPTILDVGRYPDENGKFFYTALYLGASNRVGR